MTAKVSPQKKISVEEFYASKTSHNPIRGAARIKRIKNHLAAWGLTIREVDLQILRSWL
jgi:hypothetical protein